MGPGRIAAWTSGATACTAAVCRFQAPSDGASSRRPMKPRCRGLPSLRQEVEAQRLGGGRERRRIVDGAGRDGPEIGGDDAEARMPARPVDQERGQAALNGPDDVAEAPRRVRRQRLGRHGRRAGQVSPQADWHDEAAIQRGGRGRRAASAASIRRQHQRHRRVVLRDMSAAAQRAVDRLLGEARRLGLVGDREAGRRARPRAGTRAAARSRRRRWC